MKKLLSLVPFALVVLVVVFLVAGPVAARNEAIQEIRFNGDCAGIKFNRAGKTVTIRILTYTQRSGGQWKYIGDAMRETGSGNYVEFCGLSLYRGKVKLTAQIIVNGRIKHSMTKIFRM